MRLANQACKWDPGRELQSRGLLHNLSRLQCKG